MQTIYRVSLLILVLCLLLIPTVYSQDDCPTGEWRIDGECQALDNLNLSSEWHTIIPDGDARCAHDTEYRFWMRPGNDNLMVFFQGGGGCWDEDTCRANSGFYKEHVGINEAQTYRQGVFDFDNPDNPFADYTMVFAPSCTGDVYMGNGVVEYSEEVVIHHRGFANLKSAVDFAIAAMPEPETVFVTGCSAGSIGSSVAVPFFIEAYPDTLVTQLGDSLGLIFDTPTDMLTDLWKTPNYFTDVILAANPPDWTAYTQAEYYMALGRAYPDYTFAQFNFQFDHVQQRYFAIGEADPRAFVGENLPLNMAMIAEQTPNFRYYIGETSDHCIMPSSRLYTVEVEGVAALDWIWAVAQGNAVENHR